MVMGNPEKMTRERFTRSGVLYNIEWYSALSDTDDGLPEWFHRV
jgi:hypothetical protein